MTSVFEPEWDAEQHQPPFRWRRARVGRQAGSQRLGASLLSRDPRIPVSAVSNARSPGYRLGSATRSLGRERGRAHRHPLGFLSTLLACLIAIAGCGAEVGPLVGSENGAGETSGAYPDGSPERSLAQIDAGVGLVTDAQIRPYARALDLLEQECTNERMALADLATYTLEQAREANITMDTLSIMRDVQGAVEGGGEADCRVPFEAQLERQPVGPPEQSQDTPEACADFDGIAERGCVNSYDLCSIITPAAVAEEYGGDPAISADVARAYSEQSYVPAARRGAAAGCESGFASQDQGE